MKSAFSTQLSTVQAAREDFEWYPTTNEIITATGKAILDILNAESPLDREGGFKDLDDRERLVARYSRSCRDLTLLDIGAGNGKVLTGLRDMLKGGDDRPHWWQTIGQTLAIEKSRSLIETLPDETLLLGVDFWQTALYDKKADIIFSNPPYKQFAPWAAKVIREAPANALIYLVLPERWSDNDEIQAAGANRFAANRVVGSYDFHSSEDRKARATVELVEFWFPVREDENDPFVQFFNETFTYPEPVEHEEPDEPFAEIVARTNFIEALCICYQHRLEKLQESIHSVCRLPYDVLREFEIPKASLIASIRTKIETARKEYWQRLFDGMEQIYNRLTHQSRKNMVDLLNDRTGIDFNRDNAYAIVIWAVRNANKYFDSQLITTYENLVCSANVENYVSNKRVFKDNRFSYHYNEDEDKPSHYRLKVGHRIVCGSVGGLKNSCDWDTGLDERADHFLGDLLTIARNLDFETIGSAHLADPRAWDNSDAREFEYFDRDGKCRTLFRVRAFKNRNLHFQFDPDFIHALNVRHGRLKGWLRDDAETATELDIDPAEAARLFALEPYITPAHLRLAGESEETLTHGSEDDIDGMTQPALFPDEDAA
jgi:hypothetical protein